MAPNQAQWTTLNPTIPNINKSPIEFYSSFTLMDPTWPKTHYQVKRKHLTCSCLLRAREAAMAAPASLLFLTACLELLLRLVLLLLHSAWAAEGESHGKENKVEVDWGRRSMVPTVACYLWADRSRPIGPLEARMWGGRDVTPMPAVSETRRHWILSSSAAILWRIWISSRKLL